MTRLLTIYNDVHLFSSYGIEELRHEIEIGHVHPNVYLLGDIVDVGNAHMLELHSAIRLARRLKDDYGQRYVAGNHERGEIGDHCYVKTGNVLLAHGDWEWWGRDRTQRNWRESKGLGEIAWHMKAIMEARSIFNLRWDQHFLQNAFAMCKLWEADTYICGHKHPHERCETTWGGVRFIVLPRGKNTVEIDP